MVWILSSFRSWVPASFSRFSAARTLWTGLLRGHRSPVRYPSAGVASNAFRIGIDGNNAPIPAASPTLPQPTFPGINTVSAAAGEALDPHFRPNVVDSFDFTIQRQLGNKFILEVGYIGRRITHEYQPVNINAVPYMMTLGGQPFAQSLCGGGDSSRLRYVLCGLRRRVFPRYRPARRKAQLTAAQMAYANSFAPQPFFETSLAGTGYCNGFSSCTAAVVYKDGITGNQDLLLADKYGACGAISTTAGSISLAAC